eukprot:2175435-Amphidinium_carterae.1
MPWFTTLFLRLWRIFGFLGGGRGLSSFFPVGCTRTGAARHEAGAVASTGGWGLLAHLCVPPHKASLTSSVGVRTLRLSLPGGTGFRDVGLDRSSQASQSSSFLEEEGSITSAGASKPCTRFWLLFAAGQPGCSQAAL